MFKTFIAASIAVLALAAPAVASDFGFRGGAGFGAAIGGGSVSGTFGSTFANNQQSGFGANIKGYAQTEVTGDAAAEIQGGTNLPFRANGFARSGSMSGAGSMVDGVNGSVRNSTGGISGAGAAIGAGVGIGGAVGFSSR